MYYIFLAVPAVYIFSSFVFRQKPNWLHRRRQPAFIARNIAHRGGAGESIENSLLAFDKGLANGVEMLELDCHLTKDHQVVVHHDFALNRTAGDNGFIRDMQYQDLPRINSLVQLYYEPSIVISCDDTAENRELLRVPLLKDVFERYPATPINIDIKEDNDELIRQVSRLIQECEREHLTYWGSFSHAICQKLTAENPRIVRFCSLREAALIVLAYWLGLLPFLPLTPGVFEVPLPGEVFRKTTRNVTGKLKLIYSLAERVLNNKSMFAYLQKRGIPVYLWILNSNEEYDYAFNKLRATGVMTDYPSRLQSYLTSTKPTFVLN